MGPKIRKKCRHGNFLNYWTILSSTSGQPKNEQVTFPILDGNLTWSEENHSVLNVRMHLQMNYTRMREEQWKRAAFIRHGDIKILLTSAFICPFTLQHRTRWNMQWLFYGNNRRTAHTLTNLHFHVIAKQSHENRAHYRGHKLLLKVSTLKHWK